MKTRRIYIGNTAFEAFVMDETPERYTEFFYDHNTIKSVEEVTAELAPQTLENVMPTVYRIVTSNSKGRYEYYCTVPFHFDAESFVQNVMDNDEEGIEHMTEEQASDILSWMRRDDYNNEIPDTLTASEFSRIWNEIKGTEYWYALMTDRDDTDWGTGTYNKTEALARLEDMKGDYPDAYIAVIQEGADPICVDEIH